MAFFSIMASGMIVSSRAEANEVKTPEELPDGCATVGSVISSAGFLALRDSGIHRMPITAAHSSLHSFQCDG